MSNSEKIGQSCATIVGASILKGTLTGIGLWALWNLVIVGWVDAPALEFGWCMLFGLVDVGLEVAFNLGKVVVEGLLEK